MSSFRNSLFLWALSLASIAIFANWPRNGGSLKFWLWQAGIPLTFASWEGSELKYFSMIHLLVDIAISIGLIFFVLLILLVSNRVKKNSPT